MQRITFGKFKSAVAGCADFAVRVMPIDASKDSSGVFVICLSDGLRVFIIFSHMLKMSSYDPTSGVYSEDVYETVVLTAEPEFYESLPMTELGPFKLEWPGGPAVWRPVKFRQLARLNETAGFAVKDAVLFRPIFEGLRIEFLVGMRLVSDACIWTVGRSNVMPELFSIVPE